MAKRLKRKYREIQLKRGRFIECQGCPTVDCTCFTEMEDELLEKISHILRGTGYHTYANFCEQTQKDKNGA